MLHSEVTMSFKADFEKATNEASGGLWIVLARSYRSMQALVEHSIESLGIGLSDFMILEALLHAGPLTMSQLCRKVLLANTSMTDAVDRLAKKNLIETVGQWPGDRRTRLVGLTPAGMEFIRPIFAQHLKDIDAVMARVSSTDRAETRRILKSIGFAAREKLKQMEAEPQIRKKKKEK
jgi:MarR family 2-MHQ and catechol resistance regulon transcriptional repressor